MPTIQAVGSKVHSFLLTDSGHRDRRIVER